MSLHIYLLGESVSRGLISKMSLSGAYLIAIFFIVSSMGLS